MTAATLPLVSAITCPTPKRCGARSHLAGSQVALACAGGRAPASTVPVLAPALPADAREDIEVLPDGRALRFVSITELGERYSADLGVPLHRALERARERWEERIEGYDPDDDEIPENRQPLPKEVEHEGPDAYVAHLADTTHGGGRVTVGAGGVVTSGDFLYLAAVREGVEGLEVVFDDAGEAAWESGTPHPGGYDSATTVVVGTDTVTTFRRGQDGPHREDGPAIVTTDAEGEVVISAWYEGGLRHRGDDAAFIDDTEGRQTYYYRGQFVSQGFGVRGDLARIVEAGADPATAVGWLAYPPQIAQALARDAAAQGIDPFAIHQAWEAGVKDPGVLGEVMHGRLPLSWAVAGADAGAS